MMTGVKRALALVLCVVLCITLITPFEMAHADAAPSPPSGMLGTSGTPVAVPEPSPDTPSSAELPSSTTDEPPTTDGSGNSGGDLTDGDPNSGDPASSANEGSPSDPASDSLADPAADSTSDPTSDPADELSPQDLTTSALPLEPGTYLMHPASSADKVIDIRGASKADGADALLFRSHLGANQRFTFTADASGTYTITSVSSDKVLDVTGSRKVEGTKVIQYHVTGGTNQKWTLKQNADGSYVITSVLDTRFVLDISGSHDEDGAGLIIWQRRANAANQSFFLIPVQSAAPQTGDIVLADGTYLIRDSLSPARPLDIGGNSTAQDARVILWDETGGQNQRFVLTRDASGLYAIRPLHSGKALSVLPPSRGLVQMPYLSTRSDDISYLSQRWVISTVAGVGVGAGTEAGTDAGANAGANAETGAVRITNAATGLVLDVVGSNPQAGTLLITYPDKNTANQRFTLQPATTDSPRAGIYTLAPQSAPAKRVDIAGSSTAAGAEAIVWEAHGGQNQKFQLESTGDGAYTLTSLVSGKRLTDVSGTVVQMDASSADDQKWELREVLGGILLKNRASTQYLACADVRNLTTRAVNMSSDPFSIPTTSLFVLAGTPAINPGYYLISTQAAGNRVLDVSGSSTSAGANVLLWDKHGRANQIWLVSQNADGSYWVSSALSTMRLDVRGSSTQSGTNVMQYTPHNNANQKWYIVPADDGSFYLRSALGADLTLGAANGGTAQGSNVAVYTADGSASQRFRFTAVQDITQVRLDVPLLLQLPSYPTGCEAASVAMMLSYAGYDVSVTTVVNTMPYHSSNPNLGFVGNPRTWSGTTIYPPALLGVVRSYTGSAVDLTGASLDEFKTYLKAGKPIACWIRYGSGLHCVTITGFDEQNFYYNDPYGGKDKATSYANLTAIRAPLGYRALSY